MNAGLAGVGAPSARRIGAARGLVPPVPCSCSCSSRLGGAVAEAVRGASCPASLSSGSPTVGSCGRLGSRRGLLGRGPGAGAVRAGRGGAAAAGGRPARASVRRWAPARAGGMARTRARRRGGSRSGGVVGRGAVRSSHRLDARPARPGTSSAMSWRVASSREVEHDLLQRPVRRAGRSRAACWAEAGTVRPVASAAASRRQSARM